MASPVREPDPVASQLPSPNDMQGTKEAEMENHAATEVATKIKTFEALVIDHYTKALGPPSFGIIQKIIKEEVEKAVNAKTASVDKASEGQVDNAMTEDTFSPKDGASASASVIGRIEEAKVRVAVDLELSENEPGLIATIVQVNSDDEANQSGNAEQDETPEAAAGMTDVAPGHNPHFAASILPTQLDTHEHAAKMIEDVLRFRDEHAADPRELCTSCNERGAKFCGKCKFAVYCSKECQAADWPVHRQVCSAFAGDASCENRPSPEHRRVLYLPAFEKTPELQWAVCHEANNKLRLEFQHPDTNLFKKVAGISERDDRMQYNAINLVHILGDRRIGHSVISFTYPVDRDRPDISGLLNRSVNALSKPGYLRPFFGPLIFSADARYIGDRDGMRTLDITPRDVTNIVHFLKMMKCSSVADPASHNGEVISGLRINDRKDKLNIAMGVEWAFDSTNVSLRPLYVSDSVITLAFAVGLRWYIRPANFVGLQSGTTVWNDAKVLHYLSYVCKIRELNKTSELGDDVNLDTRFGYGPFTGSVVILHGSGSPVHGSHVLAFNNYIDELIVKREVPSRTGFERFWAKWKLEKGGSVSSVPSPYKLEKASVKDKLGVYSPALVMDIIERRTRNIWSILLLQIACRSRGV